MVKSDKETQKGFYIERKCLNSKETAAYLGMCETNVLKLLKAGVIPSIRMGRRYLVPKDSLEKWLEEQAHNSEISHNQE